MNSWLSILIQCSLLFIVSWGFLEGKLQDQLFPRDFGQVPSVGATTLSVFLFNKLFWIGILDSCWGVSLNSGLAPLTNGHSTGSYLSLSSFNISFPHFSPWCAESELTWIFSAQRVLGWLPNFIVPECLIRFFGLELAIEFSTASNLGIARGRHSGFASPFFSNFEIAGFEFVVCLTYRGLNPFLNLSRLRDLSGFYRFFPKYPIDQADCTWYWLITNLIQDYFLRIHFASATIVMPKPDISLPPTSQILSAASLKTQLSSPTWIIHFAVARALWTRRARPRIQIYRFLFTSV